MKENKEKNKLGIYIHIPFCIKKCYYCDFLSAPGSIEEKEFYVEALIGEIKGYQNLYRDFEVTSIFIGGGTPSSISGEAILRIMETIKEVFTMKSYASGNRVTSSTLDTVEITIEINPGTITRDKLLLYKKAGINRLSFGLQSTSNQELQLLGRIHTYEEFEENYFLARELGFHNINIDLISALPGQTLETWQQHMKKIILLNPEHISAYSLILEEGTPFYETYCEDDFEEELDLKIYEITKTQLDQANYHRYEISNYAKNGYECKHNITYWKRDHYLGLGLGASSCIHNTRFRNEENMKEYLKSSRNPEVIKREIEILTKEQQMEEFMFLGLRLCKGVSEKEFEQIFHTDIFTVFGQPIQTSIKEGLLLRNEDAIYLSEEGINVSNVVMSRFLFD